MLRWLFPGSFDPPTLGHMDIIKRALFLCDELIVAVLDNSHKQKLLTVAERLALLEKMRQHLPGGEKLVLKSYDGLLVDFCKQEEVSAVVRGVRNFSDYSYESEMAIINAKLAKQHETVLLPAKPELAYISSSAVRELASYGADYLPLLPIEIQTEVETLFRRKLRQGDVF